MVAFLEIKTTRHVTKMLPSVTVLGDRTALLVLLVFFCCPSSLDVFLQVMMMRMTVMIMAMAVMMVMTMVPYGLCLLLHCCCSTDLDNGHNAGW